MVGRDLHELRERIEALAAPDGRFEVVCARTGEQPFPVADRRFPDREAAAEAAGLAGRYRAALRRYDERLPPLDLVACEALPDDPPRPRATAMVEFCHDLAGATFEALSAQGFDAVERTVMDRYLDAAETVGRDELCCSLLRTAAAELAEQLSPTEQALVLSDAAGRLSTPATVAPDPVDGVLLRLRTLRLLEGFETHDHLDGGRHATVVLDGYALTADGRGPDGCPTLPLSLGLLRAGTRPAVTRATREGDRWELGLALDAAYPEGLCRAPVG
ncbi:DUF7551 domain-containing protein [Haloglomus salinum]|uniref:DUF7551 domain-containing protein n=1 Tax=Haloglomus salinum TaxID=2962673 RepID=UPI0020C97A10|nr:hypothetical protein [Haloglomus salinum]